LALPLIAFIILSFAVKVKKADVNQASVVKSEKTIPLKINANPEQFSNGKEIKPSGQPIKKEIIAKDNMQLKSSKDKKLIINYGISVKDTIPKTMGKIKRIEFLKDEKAWIFFENGLEITTWRQAVNKNYITKEKADELINDIKSKKHPLIVINGKEEPSFTESSLYIYHDDATVKTNRLGGLEAIKKYGSKGANGAIEITNEQKPHTITFTKTEVPPMFSGGEVAFRKFLERNLNAKIPVKNGAPSAVYTGEAQFIVNSDGTISDIKAITKHGFGIEEEIIRVMNISPKWIPAMQNKISVKAYHKQKITFVVAG